MRLVRTLALAIAAGFAFGLAAVWLFGQKPPERAPPVVDVLGQAAPALVLSGIAGAEMALEDFRGQPVLVNFWATWCRPCIREMPLLQQVADRHDGSLTVLGIALDEPEAVRVFLDQLDIRYPNMLAGEEADAIQRDFGNPDRLLPYSVMVDAEGVIRWRHLGELDDRLIHQALKRVGVEG